MDYYDYFELDKTPRFYDMNEAFQAAKAEAKHVLSHTKHWDLISDGNNTVYFSYRHETYTVDLPQDKEAIGKWACHLAEKTWIHPEAIYEFIHVAFAAREL